jgi:ubiquinone/menaquinone biosynthesis C-methylase UbiE
MIKKEDLREQFNRTAPGRLRWKRRNKHYHRLLEKYYQFLIPEGSRVVEIGCGTADLLNAVRPSEGTGIDFSPDMLEIARKQHPEHKYYCQDAEKLEIQGEFDYVIMSDLVGSLWDIQQSFSSVRSLTQPRSRIIISQHNFLWQPLLRFLEAVGLKAKHPLQSWLSSRDIIKLLELEGFESIRTMKKILLPLRIPLIGHLFNSILANLPLLNHLCLVNFIVARPKQEDAGEYSVSIVIPARNEKGNIENAILRSPRFGKWQEFIFVEGHSSDGTYEEMLRVKDKYSDYRIKTAIQTGTGKANAVREGFELAEGDILMILDADLTTPPEDMPKFYEAIRTCKGEFINGCRLVYPMEEEAMRTLNYLGNKFFSWTFSFLLGQHLKDTLCGTKVLLKEDYLKIKKNRKYFGDFDPFGDFDLLFGASKLNMKITEIPVRYRQREYGSTQISKFRHGWLLIRMSWFASRKIRFN